MNWGQLIRDRVIPNLAAHLSPEQKEEIIAQAIADTEAGRVFGAAPEEPKPETNERLEKLRASAHEWQHKRDGWPPR